MKLSLKPPWEKMNYATIGPSTSCKAPGNIHRLLRYLVEFKKNFSSILLKNELKLLKKYFLVFIISY